MKDIISLILSTVAITISAITAWLTLFKKGKLKMTQPTPLLLGYEKGKAKISFYTMFYSTAFRGQVIENMYILFDQNGETLPFNKWAYSSESNIFAAGCYIKPEGIAQNHQFYVTDNNFFFQPGSIRINVYAKLPNKKKQSHLKCIHLQIPKEKKSICEDKTKGLMFEWEPDKNSYLLRIDTNPEKLLIEVLKKLNS